MLLAVVVPMKVFWAATLTEVDVLAVGAVWIVASPDADNHGRNGSTEQAQFLDYRCMLLKLILI